jgi:hypothetical protein
MKTLINLVIIHIIVVFRPTATGTERRYSYIYIYIYIPGPYRAVNTLRLSYKNQSVNVV